MSFSGVREKLWSSNNVDRVTWLANESIRLHDQINRTKKPAHAETLVVETQEKNYLPEQSIAFFI